MIGSRTFRAVLVSATLAIACAPSQQAFGVEHDPGIWTVFSTTDAFSGDNGTSRWHYWFDAQARYFDIGSGANQWLVRPGIGYEIGDGVKVWAGYARFQSRNSAGREAEENRYWQQIDWRAGRWLDGQITMRVRLEQRSVSVGDDLGLVFRFMTKYVRPVGDDGDKSLIVGLEPFVSLRDTDWAGEAGIRQNRTLIGMGWRVSDKLTLEAGYMNQYLFVDSAEDRINHLAILTIKAKL